VSTSATVPAAAPADEGRPVFVWSDEWLARRHEDVIDPDLPILDPHHHLWDYAPGRGQYLASDLDVDTTAGHDVRGTVFIDCSWNYRSTGPEHLHPVGETETVVAAAAGGATDIRAIVSFADMTLGDGVTEVLDAHVAAGAGRFRGIRHSTAYDAAPVIRRRNPTSVPGLMADPSFVSGVRRLAAAGLSFDAWLYHPQIPELAALARAVPDGTFVLDHLGGPLGIGPYAGRRDEVLDGWRPDITELATCPNVVVKLGGLGMPIFGLGFDARPDPPSSDDLVHAWGGPVEHAIDAFGVDRCMFESNFPVDKRSCSYVTLWNAFKKMTAGAGPAERAALFHDTAAATYRI
jgi:predicted TIM-barrel fold metal-dependent hydrolase